jgi:modulator of FtsH protease
MTPAWTSFMIAAAGASAALAGLVVVAMSVNIARIISFPHLPARAAATIAALLLILIVSMAALIPQSMLSFGIEAFVASVGCWLMQVWAGRWMLVARRNGNRPWYEPLRGIILGQVETLPFIIGSVMVAFAEPSGFAWIAAGTLAAFTLSMYNAWVLLVEILR